MTVSERFTELISNLKLTKIQREDGITKHEGVRSCLNRHYYEISSSSANNLLIGSWGKNTEIRPPRDIDILFTLPPSVYYRIEKTSGNKQSYLLQEVKSVLQNKYPFTTIRGDGQVVVVPFQSFSVEVVPAFLLESGKYWICDTHAGGKWKTTDPEAEFDNIRNSDIKTRGNTRDLIRMLKCWQEYCNVPLNSFFIELLAIDFLNTWEYSGNTTVYYDWMTRDFLDFLNRKSLNLLFVPGTFELIYLNYTWSSKVDSALARAKKACDYEREELPYSAGEEWQKMFGTFIPSG